MGHFVCYYGFMNSLKLFLGLQICDLLTTLLFLQLGVQEGNPLIQFLMSEFSPLVSLLIVKSLGVGLGFVAYYRGWNFTRLNAAYILLIVWNVTAIVLQTVSK